MQDRCATLHRAASQGCASGGVEELARSSLKISCKHQSFLWRRTVIPLESVLEGRCRREEVPLRFSHCLREGCGRRCVLKRQMTTISAHSRRLLGLPMSWDDVFSSVGFAGKSQHSWGRDAHNSHAGGHRFESCRAHHSKQKTSEF